MDKIHNRNDNSRMIIALGILILGPRYCDSNDEFYIYAIVFMEVYGGYMVYSWYKAKEQLEEWRRERKNTKNHTLK